ncbi:flavodoxin family protein [Cupriavidus basilensis]|uniref:Flavodoxins n=1 Tax=Cupriavidus basilensis TaxID=68895 RepID=A0A0C4YEX8_9BURK|nr:flavodoxin family protein [Cupriavidus basilensis]AJG19321.1 Flavodoxins [Cupriavidus basilensis]
MEKILIVYYSRTGTARQAAEELAAQSGWPLAEVGDQASRSGLLGDARCVLDILLQRHVGYRYAGPALDDCQRLVIVAPIWVGHLAAPMRSFLRDHMPLACKTSVICVMARQGAFRAAEEIARLATQPPSPVLALRQADVASGAATQALRAFAEQVEAANGRSGAAQRPAWLSPKEA